jgi:hypothetical protein
VLTTLHQIGGGWTAARLTDFTSLVQCGKLLYSLVLNDGDGIWFGRTAPQMQINIGAVREAAGKGSSLVIVVNTLGFGKDDPTETILSPMQRVNMKQNLTVLTGSGMVMVQGNSQNLPTHNGSNADGSPTIEIYATEARPNAKEFHRIDTVKCSGKGVAMEWYDNSIQRHLF